MIAAFGFSSVSLSSFWRGHVALPGPLPILVASAVSLLFFMQLRIADEFKDDRDDSQYRPYRPVPRGLVTLRELRNIGIAGGLLQLGLSVLLDPLLVFMLVPVWLYMGLMGREFFLREWWKAHPFVYLWSHMAILPLIQLYASACDWLVTRSVPPRGLIWLLLAGFFTGIAMEIGRKVRAPEDEERGVDTYTSLWGRETSVLAWLGASAIAAIATLVAAGRSGAVVPLLGPLAVLLGTEGVIAWRFLRHPVTGRARLFEPVSGLSTLMVYLGLGAIPLLQRL